MRNLKISKYLDDQYYKRQHKTNYRNIDLNIIYIDIDGSIIDNTEGKLL